MLQFLWLQSAAQLLELSETFHYTWHSAAERMLNQQQKQSGSSWFSLGNTGHANIPLIETDQQNQKLQKHYKEWTGDEYLLLERPMAWEKKTFPHLWSCSSYSKGFLPNISWSIKITARESALLLLQCNLRKPINISFKFISTLVTETKFGQPTVRCF